MSHANAALTPRTRLRLARLIVVTRRNDRRLTTHTHGFVKNGDTWTVQRRHGDGDLTMLRADHAQVRLPHDYVITHLELGYATTAARAQGRTVDTAHAS